MSATLDCPVLGIENVWPDDLFMLEENGSGRHACLPFARVAGLAVFSSTEFAAQFAARLPHENFTIVRVTFDEAREIAKTKPHPVCAVLLCDDPKWPRIHFVA